MNEIKIYLKPSGSLSYLYKDFDLYEGCYRNSQLTVFVPKSLLYENENGTFVNLVKTGAILTAPNGSKLTTKSYYLDYEREQTNGVYSRGRKKKCRYFICEYLEKRTKNFSQCLCANDIKYLVVGNI